MQVGTLSVFPRASVATRCLNKLTLGAARYSVGLAQIAHDHVCFPLFPAATACPEAFDPFRTLPPPHRATPITQSSIAARIAGSTLMLAATSCLSAVTSACSNGS